MQTLKELIQLIEQYKIKEKGVRKRKSQAKVDKFYELIVSGVLETNEDAATYFFNASPVHVGFRKLKTSLKNQLLEEVSYLDLNNSSSSPYDLAYINGWKNLATTKMLFNQGAAYSGAKAAHKILKKAREYEFTELALNACRALRSYYATRFPNLTLFEKYNTLVSDYTNRYTIENMAEEYYLLLTRYFIGSKAGYPQVAEHAEKYCSELEPHLRQKPTFRLIRSYYQIRVASYMCRHDYINTLAYCDEALHKISSKPFFSPEMGNFFYFQKIVCCIQLNQYDAGKKITEALLQYEDPGSFNWFQNRILSIQLAMHTSNYQEAYSIFQQTTAQPSFKHLDPTNLERWKIHEAYLMYLSHMEDLTIDATPLNQNFRISKFLNQVPIYSLDKRGMNIPILVVHILFTLAQKRYDVASNRIDAIARYSTRYLVRDDTLRSNLFIHMLIAINKSNFNPIAVERKAKHWYKLLLKEPKAHSNYDIEIIPYEVLWPIVFKSLEDSMQMIQPNRNKSRKRI